MRIKKIIVLFTLFAIITTSTISVFALPEKDLDLSNYNTFKTHNHVTEQAVSSKHLNDSLTRRDNYIGNLAVSSNVNTNDILNIPPLALQPSTRLGDIFENLSAEEKRQLISEIVSDSIKQFGSFICNNGPDMVCVSFYVTKAIVALSWENLFIPGWNHIGKPLCFAGLDYAVKPLCYSVKNTATNYVTNIKDSAINCAQEMAATSVIFVSDTIAKGSDAMYYGTLYGGKKVAGLTWNYIAAPTLNAVFSASKNYVFAPIANAAIDRTIQAHTTMIKAKNKICDVIKTTASDSFYSGQKISSFIWHNGIVSPGTQIGNFVGSAATYGASYAKKKVASFFEGTPVNQATIYRTKQVSSFIHNNNINNYTSYNRNKIGNNVNCNKTNTSYNQQKVSILSSNKSVYCPIIIPSINNNTEKVSNMKLSMAKVTALEVIKSFTFY